MRIQSIHVKNFRCLSDATLDCRDLTAMVGRNGAGKSAFLQALNMFYDRGALALEADYYNQNIANDISITVTFIGLRTEELEEFLPYLDNEQLVITKRFASMQSGGTPTTGKYFASERSFPPFAPIADMAAPEKVSAIASLIESKVLPPMTTPPKNGKQVVEFMTAFEHEHPEL